MPLSLRPSSAICLTFAALLLLPVSVPGQTTSQPRRSPNVILIVADDLGWNAVGYHGGFARTPHIDRVARSGVALDRFYVAPMCSPTRAGLMTGRYAMRYGMGRSVVRPWMKSGLPPEERTLPEALSEVGYGNRGAFGKWHLGHLEEEWHPLSQGFTQYKGCYNGAADYFTRVRDGEVDWHHDREPVNESGYTTDLIADAAAAFVRRQAKDDPPFFCYVAFTAPHDPLQVPDKYLVPYVHLDRNPNDGKPSPKQLVAAMTACMDDGIGRILSAVEETGAARQTLIWFLSDNGGVRRINGANDPLRAGKLTVYEGGVRVPSAVWWPGVIEGGRTVTTPISHVDVLPTLVSIFDPALAAKGSAGPLDGRNVLDVLTGKRPGAELASRDIYSFHGQDGPEAEQLSVLSADGWKLVIHGPDVSRPAGYATPRHRVELFHLDVDPLEKADLSGREPGRVAALAKNLVEFRKSEPAEASMPPVNQRPVDFRPPPGWRNGATPGRTSTAAVAPTIPAKGGAPSKRPNILFILIDDMGYRDLGCFGGTRTKTPHIDRLAAEGMRFNHFYVASPICSPSRVALTTGQYPARWRITSYLDNRQTNARRGMKDWLSPEAPTLARMLRGAGYSTAHVGKWHMGGQRDVGDAPPIAEYGFDASLTNFEGLGPRILAKFPPRPDGTPFRHGPTDTSAKFGGPGAQWVERHLVSQKYVDRAIEEMKAAGERGKPFFINLWPDDVHSPCFAPPGMQGDRSPAANYAGVLTELDRQLGRAFDFVRSRPELRDNTIILLCSDNGHEPGMGSSGELRGAKGQLYEGGIRSPLIAWWPGGMPKSAVGTSNDVTVVTGIDMPPSLLALAGVAAPKPEVFDGIDMSAALAGRAAPPRDRPVMWLRPPDRPGKNGELPDLAIRDGNWKLLVHRDGGEPAELFDVIADPSEKKNMAAGHADVVERLTRAVTEWETSVVPKVVEGDAKTRRPNSDLPRPKFEKLPPDVASAQGELSSNFPSPAR